MLIEKNEKTVFSFDDIYFCAKRAGAGDPGR